MRRAPALLLLCAVASGADPAVSLNEAGLEHLAAGRADEARRAFEAALELMPDAEVLRRNLAAALVLRAEERLSGRELGEALGLLERATRLHPERLRYRMLLGRARLEGGDDLLLAAARADLDLVLERDPDHLEALMSLGEIAYLARELDAAVARWRRALELRPGDPEILRLLAKAEREREVEGSFGEIESPLFLVRHSKEIAAARAQAVLVLCEEARGRLSALYGSYPPRIVVTLYTPSEFRSATALHGWVAGVSDGTIRLSLGARDDPAALAATIRHEMTHHVVRAIAPTAPVWLHEGLAQIEEGRSAEKALARLRDAGGLRDSLLSAAILREHDPRRVALFYDVALAFTRYLDDGQRGAIQRLLRELGSGKDEATAFREAFGDTRENIFERWTASLR
jgi:tetratricopeptide (TPR) repeat protein